MKNIKPWPRWFAWSALVVASHSLVLALVNLAINTERVGSWLPLLVLMPWPLILELRSLRRPDKTNRFR
ncbi:hypothetical protein ABID92_001873 [Frigoribacterium sp. PvP120]|uniref:hypothetical protein n=1 Tax=unclassified Frigoribacterium TaxID=2627005 RepID=UPI001AE84325|nr:hypothetical protein [Frigoribacterium sp. PvP121]MBP1240175.1 hypothetical protein [Frigoribacterium sp. PvP121]